MPHLKGEKLTTPPASVATAPSAPVTSLSTKKSATMKPGQYTDIEDGDGVDRQHQQQKEGQKLPAASKSERQPPEKHPQQPLPQAPRESSPQAVNVEKAAKKRRRSTSNESGKDKKKGNISPQVVPTPPQKKQQKQLKGLKLKSTQLLQPPAAAVVLQHQKKSSPSASSSPSSLPRNSKKKVEMQYLYKNKKVKVKLFDTLHKASDKTGISIPMIKVVCEEGGGFLKEAWFEYHQPITITSGGGTDHHGTTPPSHTATTTTTTTNSEISTTNNKTDLMTTTDTDPETPSHKKNHSGRQSIVPKPREFFMGGTFKFDVTSLRPLDPKTCKLSTSTGGVGSGGPPLMRGGTTTSSPGGAARRPRRKRVIELICRKTGQTLVCFSEIRHAAMALGITPQQAVRACSSYGTPEQYEFLEFRLRFKVDSKVYLYGSNEEDFQPTPTGITDAAAVTNTNTLRDSQDETHRERLARWSRLMAKAATTKSPASPQPSPPKPSKIMTTTVAAKAVTLPATTTAATTSPARPPPPRRVVEKEETTTYHEIIPDEQVVQETLKLFEDTSMVDSSMSMSSSKSPVSMAMVPILTDNNPPNETMESLCIFCQEQSAGIIFEPCGHCVVCEDCASWACRHFCPRCRTSIFKRRRSTSLFRGVKLDLALKPTTFSAYSFMDF